MRANEGVRQVTFQIERIRSYLVGHKPAPGRLHHGFEHNNNGFLVTGYEDGGDWLVSPLGRQTSGKIFRDRPTMGWAIGDDRQDYHRLHLYILDLPAKSYAEVSGLSLTRNYHIVDYDSERLVLIRPPTAERGDLTRELVIVDIASAKIADRFVLKGYTHLFRFYRSDSVGLMADGRLILDVSLLGENNERLYKHGIARIHPLTHEISFELFPVEGHAHVLISPSGRHVLKANKTVRPVPGLSTGLSVTPGNGQGQEFYEHSIEMWAGAPLCHIRNLPLEWASNDDAWEFPTIPQIVWQPDEAAFWWITQKQAICVGLDGCSSPPMRLDTHRSVCSALPGRIAEFALERETTVELCRLDGSPSDDLSPRDAPAPTIVTPSAAEQKRQRNAQAALKKIVSAKSDLKLTLKTAEAAELVGAIDDLTAALDRGLAWFADDEEIIKISIKIAGVSCNEKRFFGLVEKLGSTAVPALTRLLAKCRLDADLRRVWSGNLDDGQQAFGIAAKALAGIDAGAWAVLAEYEQCIDDWHELYFRGEVVPHFIKTHGWREESFALALADIAQVRGNLGDDFVYSWRRSGLAAAAEAAYAPEAFAELMISTRDRMLSSPVGTFANFVARVAEDPPPTYGWHNYDRLFSQIKGSLTPWEVHLFAKLQDRAGR